VDEETLIGLPYGGGEKLSVAQTPANIDILVPDAGGDGVLILALLGNRKFGLPTLSDLHTFNFT